MSIEARKITEQRFTEEVLQAEGPVVVDFSASWCPPCRALDPILERLASEAAGRWKVVVLDVDQSPHLTQRFGVRGAPTLIVFAHGQPVRSHVGLASREKILELIEAARAQRSS